MDGRTVAVVGMIKGGQVSMFGNGMIDGVQLDMAPPIYKKGDIIDIRPSSNGAPNRIKINGVMTRVSSVGAYWIYDCEFESNHSSQILTEAFILEKSIDKHHQVYNIPVIVDRYKNGWRFYGNYYRNSVSQVSNTLVATPVFKNVRMCEAYNKNGKMSTTQVSLWIRYESPINGDDVKDIDVILK